MAKKRLKVSMFVLDVLVLLAIFISVFVLFEVMIKKVLITYSVNKFYDSLKTTQFDLANSASYLEEKKELNYKKNMVKIFDYLKISTLKRSKYDHSIFGAVFPVTEDSTSDSKKAQTKENKTLSAEVTSDNEIFNNIEQSGLLIAGRRDQTDCAYTCKDFKYESFKKMTKEKYGTFFLEGRTYIGIAKYSEIGIRKNFDRENDDLVYPIFVLADRSDEFFYLINKVRNVFVAILALVFAVGAIYKVYNTIIISREIQSISNRMVIVDEEIKNQGIVQGALDKFVTTFKETSELDSTFLDLVKSLEKLGSIISGIADHDLFVATLKNDDSVLNPHEEMMGVIFLDIKGFTTISERHKDNIMNIVNHIWIEVEGIIGKRYGKINKYEGDACLIIFRDKDNKGKIHTALNALYSGIQMLELVPKICKDLDIDFNFRVGIDFGKVTYGKTGTDNNFELGVIGDPVNTAARFEALSKQYNTNLLITDSAFVHTNFNFKDNYNEKDEIKKDIDLKFLMVDKARPKGKKEAKEIITVLKADDKKDLTFIGSEKYFKQNIFDEYSKLTKKFSEGIKPWQDYRNAANDKEAEKLLKEAEKSWSDLARDFGMFFEKYKFPPAEHFIKTLLKFEEFDDYCKDPQSWFKKDLYKVKSPSEEWIKLGTIELAK